MKDDCFNLRDDPAPDDLDYGIDTYDNLPSDAAIDQIIERRRRDFYREWEIYISEYNDY